METAGFALFGTAWWVAKTFGAEYAAAYYVFDICCVIFLWKRMIDGQEDNGHY